MHVLYLTPYFPYPPIGGGRIRALQILKGLAARHKVSLVALIDESFQRQHLAAAEPFCTTIHTVPLARRGKPAGWKSKGMKLLLYTFQKSFLQGKFLRRNLFSLLKEEGKRIRWDAVLLETLWMSPYLKVLGRIQRIWHFPNLESLSLQRELQNASSLGARFTSYFEGMYARRVESRAGRSGDLCILVSEEDRRAFLKLAPHAKTLVLPNGIDTSATQFLEEPGGEGTILFVGSFQYPPNVDAVLYFYREIFPLVRKELPGTRWLVAGSNPPEAFRPLSEAPGIEVRGFVEDLKSLYREVSAVVAPLRIGSGSRLKILEAMAWGRPVVSTPVGCEGLEVKEGTNIMIGSTPGKFAEILLQVLKDNGLARRIGREGRKLVEEKYSWEKIQEKIQSQIGELLET